MTTHSTAQPSGRRLITAYDTSDPAQADILTPRCMFCGRQGWVRVPQDAVEALSSFSPVQEALPTLDPCLREQITSGVHPECWPAL